MKKSDEYSESKQAAYVATVISQLREKPHQKREVTTVQSASTTELNNLSPESRVVRDRQRSDPAYWADLAERAKAPHPETVKREITPGEFALIGAARMRPKNSIGQSEESASSPERREKARYAYQFSPGTPFEELSEAEKAKVQVLEPLVELKTITKEEWKPLSFWGALKHRLKGHKIKKVEK